jgi:hypothetical protein
MIYAEFSLSVGGREAIGVFFAIVDRNGCASNGFSSLVRNASMDVTGTALSVRDCSSKNE